MAAVETYEVVLNTDLSAKALRGAQQARLLREVIEPNLADHDGRLIKQPGLLVR